MEKFFGIARQRHGGNFYSNVFRDVSAAGKDQKLHQLMENDVTLSTDTLKSAYNICYESVSLEDIELLKESSLEDTEGWLSSSGSLKHKAVFMASYLSFKYGENDTPTDK